MDNATHKYIVYFVEGNPGLVFLSGVFDDENDAHRWIRDKNEENEENKENIYKLALVPYIPSLIIEPVILK